MNKDSKIARCRYCHHYMGKQHNEHHCVVNGWENENVKTVTDSDCEACDRFKSKYIEYPLTINGIENQKIDTEKCLGHEIGCLCEIRPCADEYKDQSYIGIYIGDLPISITTSHDENTGILKNGVMTNPAIFVPELKKIIYGCESWWREIKSIEDFKGISQEDIDNAWYVKLLSKMQEAVEKHE